MKRKIVVGRIEMWEDMGPGIAPNCFASLQLYLINIEREEHGLEPLQNLPTPSEDTEDMDGQVFGASV